MQNVQEWLVFWKLILRTIGCNDDFTYDEQKQEEGKTLNEEIIRAMKENEVIESTDNSCEEEFMPGT